MVGDDRDTPKIPTPVPKSEPDSQYSHIVASARCQRCGHHWTPLVLVNTPAVGCEVCGWLVKLRRPSEREMTKPTDKTKAVTADDYPVVIRRIIRVG